ncbi:MAG: CoA-binding protein [Deltaproteobacteria bacterium]|nr:CoA-binding protein [Deltaproteobacteria bacterium]
MNLDSLFYPKSVAVVGASDNLGGGKMPYFQILRVTGFEGALYPVNPRRGTVDGVPAYGSIDELPESVDYAIVAAPVEQSIDIVKAAVRKQIKFIHFFTSGFGETGNRQLEEDLIREARKGDLRIVGPNCVGVYCSESRIAFTPGVQEETPGTVAFLGQSGGVTGNFLAMATTRKIFLNKVVSYGNQIDLRVEDYLDYLAGDKNIRLIACYIEDIKDTEAFLKTLRRTTAVKPVIILKGGKTDTGSKAAASHTGAMASNYTIWAAAVRQHGGLLVDDFEQMMDLVMLGTSRKLPRGKRVGFLGAGGGISVLFTDLAEEAGLPLPELSEKTQRKIGEVIMGVNTSTANPVDLGAFGFDLNVMLHTMQAIDEDDGIDVIIPYFSVEYIMRSEFFLNVKNNADTIFEMAEKIKKPVIPILSSFVEDNLDAERTRISTFATLRKAGFPVYSKIQDAVYSIGSYFEWAAKQGAGKKR